MSTFNQRELRDVLGAFVTGVTVITTRDTSGQPQGVTANSFSSVSLDPPLVLWSQALNAKSFPAFRDNDRFVVNILGHHQIDVSQRFAKSGEDKFSGIDISLSEHGLPILDGCTARLECRKIATYPGGDHAVFLGQVERVQRSSCRPLAFGGGNYMSTHVHDLGPISLDPGVSTMGDVHALQMVNLAMSGIGERLGAALGLAVWGNQGPTVIRWEPSRNPVVRDLRTGLVVSTVFSACGLVFSAYLPAATTSDLIAQELKQKHQSGGHLPYSREELDVQLASVRERGFSHSMPQRFGPDIGAIAAPVFDSSGALLMVLTAVDTIERTGGPQDGVLQRKLLQETATLSRRLGFQASAPTEVA